jgi:hypothetical protein
VLDVVAPYAPEFVAQVCDDDWECGCGKPPPGSDPRAEAEKQAPSASASAAKAPTWIARCPETSGYVGEPKCPVEAIFPEDALPSSGNRS